MSIHVAVRHHTRYSYDKLVAVSPQIVRLRPAPHSRTPILGYSLKILPENHFINWQQDPFGNYLARIVFPDKIHELSIDVEVIADMININPFDFFLEEYAENFPFTYKDQLLKELAPYLEIREDGPLLTEWIATNNLKEKEHTIDFLVRLNQAMNKDINYSIRLEAGVQPCETTLESAIGSCRDSAWLMVQVLRHFGLAARFVSGYLVQLKADEKPVEGPAGTDKDFTDLHAWTEVYIPGAGWIGLDPTSGLLAGEGHIPLAATPDYESAAPLTGFTEPCQVTFSYENNIERIYERPRVTKPYSDAQWTQINHLGLHLDSIIKREDLRLTMGGEPTFVSTLDRDSPEWNDQADGASKKELAMHLALRLRDDLAPEGLMHFGQGKWYPGEPLPRWQYALLWRKDGEPVWKNQRLMGNPLMAPYAEDRDAERLIGKLCESIGLDSRHIHPCYEDVYYFMWEKEQLPLQIDPKAIAEHEKLIYGKFDDVFRRGLDKPAGFALPLDFQYDQGKWISGPWKLKSGHVFLMPGNSPIGLRLPLKRLPQVAPSIEEQVLEPSPLEDLGALPQYENLTADSHTEKEDVSSVKPNVIRTALCAEVRQGRLFLFMPPLKSIEPYLELCHIIEDVCATLNLSVVLEGYAPPYDTRVEKIVVGPDPGVIEVNIHPASSWQELVKNYTTLFEAAKASMLSPEKFMLDGRHTGTGGGNHITLGGITPADSPLLRKPHLLRSFVNFWQNHPGLSYLFSSAFIGPTSQAPRVDEGRLETLYELEIAFDQVDKFEDPPAWIVDRIFRNLLIDITGNTHRAEFCIDKLYNPDSQSGRLGILEMRGFDMPPHREMCLVQFLLIRVLTTCFWLRPYRQRLVRWGTQLHDKFLIHHFVKEDMDDVIDYIRSHGFKFEPDWLAPFFEFRFPILGEAQVKDTRITLRAAIEPWNVLGEEMTSTGTSRYVDSSLERVEVSLEGFNVERYKLLCNQVDIPLTSTAVQGKFVAGIRYKAWNPPSALHPTVGVDVPLVFDIYDTWNERSIGGCTYHVAHPGGRNYDTFPVNSYEAEGRRISRFWDFNHSIRQRTPIINPATSPEGSYRYVEKMEVPTQHIEIKRVPENQDYPNTVDLRRSH